MSKLSRVKGWLTVKEAAINLSGLIGETVAESDIYHLAMRGELRISVLLVGECFAQRGQIVDESEITWREVISMHKLGETIRIPNGTHIGGNNWIRFDETIVRISGVHFLPMIGGEAVEIERRYHRLTEGPEVELLNLDGVFVCNKEKTVFYKLHDWQGSIKSGRFYFPLANLPDEMNIVVTSDSLNETANGLNAQDSARALGSEEHIPPKTRHTIFKEYRAMAIAIAHLSEQKWADHNELAEIVLNACTKAGHEMPVTKRTIIDNRLSKG